MIANVIFYIYVSLTSRSTRRCTAFFLTPHSLFRLPPPPPPDPIPTFPTIIFTPTLSSSLLRPPESHALR